MSQLVSRLVSRYRSGTALLEALLALTLFLVVMVGMLSMVVRHTVIEQRSQDISAVAIITQEGLEAVQSIAYHSWSTLTVADYGLHQVAAQWQLSDAPDVVQNRYTRTVTVSPVQRDANCTIVTSGGTVDPDTKHITVTITWPVNGHIQQRSASAYYTNWKNPEPLCTVTQAGSLVIHVDGAYLDSTKNQMQGVTLENTGLASVTIDQMILSWVRADGDSSGVSQSIKVDGVDRWHASNGIGSPEGTQPSGTTIDIVDVTIAPGQTVTVDRFRFADKLDGAKFTITAIMADASSTVVTTDEFLP